MNRIVKLFSLVFLTLFFFITISKTAKASDIRLIKDINLGSLGISIGSYITFGDNIFFSADDGVHGIELWKSDGTEAGTVMVKDIKSGSGHSAPMRFIILNNKLYFTADDGIHGTELWKSDGTEAGTVMVKDINPGVDPYSSALLDFKIFNNTLYFSGTDGVNGEELWKSDGTEAGTVMVKDINPGSSSSYVYDLNIFNNFLYFLAGDGVHGAANLWRSDGTEVGTVYLEITDPPFDFSNFLPSEENIFLIARREGNWELWKSDGTLDKTSLVGTIIEESADPPGNLIIFNDSLFFTINNYHTHLKELWKGTSDSVVSTSGHGPGYFEPNSFKILNNNLYYVFNQLELGKILYRSNGEGSSVDVFNSGSGTLNPVVFREALYFFPWRGELWQYDGSDSTLVSDPGGFLPNSDLIVLGNKLLFSGSEMALSENRLLGFFWLPDAPTELSAVSSTSSITVSWPDDANEYWLENISSAENSAWTTSSSFTFSGLACGTGYNFQLKSRFSSEREGPWSEIFNFQTAACPRVSSGYSAPPVQPQIGDKPFAISGLRLSFNDDQISQASQVALSSSPDFSNAFWSDFRADQSMDLSLFRPGKMYVKFRNQTGGESPIFSLDFGLPVEEKEATPGLTSNLVEKKRICGPYLLKPIKFGVRNDPAEVKKLQEFLLNKAGFSNLIISGNYDLATFKAVKIFQERHAAEVLAPWNIDRGTGYVYKTTIRLINQLACQ